jgi:hypothetical protein
MAKYRQIQISFWQDGFILTLPPEEKYFYIYLMSNSKTTQCGIYELPLKVIEMETGLSPDRIFELINKFIGYRKIRYNEETREIFLLNWLKHNSLKSPKVRSCAEKELLEVKHIPYQTEFVQLSIQYGYPINRLSIDSGEEEEKEEEQKEEQEQEKVLHNSNLHQERLRKLVIQCNIKGAGIDGLETVYSYIGQADLEVIEKALKKSEGKHVNYFVEIINGMIAEGKTSKDSVRYIQAVPDKKLDLELESRRIEIARNKWIQNGGDPSEFRYPATS